VVVTVSRLRVCAGTPRVGSPCPWPVGPGVGVHLVRLGSRDRVVLWCLLCCLSSLCSSSRACKYKGVLRNVCRICFALSLPWFGSAVSVSGWGPIRPPVVVWFSALLTLPTWPGVSAVLPATCAISSVMHVKRLPHYSPSRGVSPATTSAYVIKCFISLEPSPLVISSYLVKAVPR
jgi:hypothetical protein